MTTALFRLVAAVECRGINYNPDIWETIAAFNNHQVAENYATECRAAHPEFSYRVIDLSAAPPVSK